MALLLTACAASGESQPGEHADDGERPTAGSPDCSDTASDLVAAEAMARMCGTAVEAVSERDEYSQLFVEQSGARTRVVSVVPQRVKRADGTWEAADVAHLLPDQDL